MNPPRATLYVEGKDDLNSIIHLLRRHFIDTSEAKRSFDIRCARSGDESETESVETLLRVMCDAIRQSRALPVGFVVDADSRVQDRWNAVRDRLESLGVDCPRLPVEGGFVAEVHRFRTSVGVWMMPNNADTGMLEHFLYGLIASGDLLLPIAQDATKAAISEDRRFPEIHEHKAIVHTWLAWQEKPGLPFGTAIKAEYFRHDSANALAFVSWFKRLFSV